ncbi:MAG TPA: type II toxin-antitoxin system VapC family toxin [Terracidiphilus sp.]|nr:type II toxin-antitoxin system VapC family toxin [Terracidiphilus sp.]
MPNAPVLDSSAILALLNNEAGKSTVAMIIHGALLSAVNLAEIYSKLLLWGVDESFAAEQIDSLQCDVCPFTEALGRAAGALILATKPYGLSLGDRACLALAMERKAKVYTTDRNWKNLSLGIDIEVIR